MKPGYKKTQIGEIPEDWEMISFSKCFDTIRNNTLSRAELNNDGGSIRNIHYGDILIKFPSIVDCQIEQIPFVNEGFDEKVGDDYLQDGDVIIADTAEDNAVGKAIEVNNIGESKLVAGLHTMPCRPTKVFAEKYLGYYINSRVFHDQIIPYITGTKVSSISKKAIDNTLILVPQTAEQRRIAEALSDVDELIASLEKLIEKKKALKQGVMQELITGKRRLPGFTGEWKKFRLGKYGYLLKDSINPQLYDNKRFSEYSMPAFDVDKKPDLKSGASMHSNRTIIKGEVLLFNKLNVRQKRIWYIEECSTDSICSSEFLPYCSAEISLKLLAQILQSDETTTFFVENSTGTSNSQKRITPTLFLEYEVLLPEDKAEQTAIANLLGDFDMDILQMQKRKEILCKLKSGMMSELLTGRIRIE